MNALFVRAPALLSALLMAALPAIGHAQIVQIPGSAIGDLVGQASAAYSFFSVRDGNLDPVPHQ